MCDHTCTCDCHDQKNPSLFTPVETEIVNWYETHGADWAAAHSTAGYWSNELRIFSSLLPSGRLLEIGTGGGRDALELIKRYDYTGTDITSALVETGRQRLGPEIPVHNVGIDDLDFPGRPFDGFWCSAVMLHLPHERVRPALENIRRQIRVGSVGFISTKAGRGQGDEYEDGRTFFYWSPAAFIAEITAAGFAITRLHLKETGRTTWICAFVRALD